jgi:general stress protein YciG
MSISVIEAGRRGGLSVLRKRGREYYAEIGRKGQKALRDKHPNMAPVWGKQGGRPKKPTLLSGGSEQIKT